YESHTRCGDAEASLPDPTLLDLVPPFRFAMVEEGVYRGAYPTLRNFPFLRGLGLRTIVSLIPEEPTYDLRCFAAAENITLRYIHAERYKGEVQLLPTEMNEVLQLLINVERHPIYVHCLDGRHIVGLVIMGLRKLQFWEVNCSHLEYQRFTRSVQDEVAFITDYSGP
ncbi:putative tyrosine phospatase-like protein, partial [Trypanosoma cruzi]